MKSFFVILYKIVIVVLATVIIFPAYYFSASADEIDDIQGQIDEQNSKIKEIKSALEKSRDYVGKLNIDRNSLYGEIHITSSQIEGTKNQIKENQKSIDELTGNLDNVKKMLEDKHLEKNTKIVDIYYDFKSPRIAELFQGDSIGTFLKLWKYKEVGVKKDRDEIQKLDEQSKTLSSNLQESEFLQQELITVNNDLEEKLAGLNSKVYILSTEISKEQQRQQALSGEMINIQSAISDLTTKQQELIRLKLLATQQNTSVGSNEQGVEYLEEAPFTDGFVFFTYGYPHRVGMSQYGAYGRAKVGQTAEQILQAYYSNVEIDKNHQVPVTIPVQGYGSVNLQEYLKGIAEMPSCWDIESLKAQVIAARTYALNYIYYTWNGDEFVRKSDTPICTTQSCQVYVGHPKGGACADKWYQAVDETKSWVITYKGKPITAWYASTAGGYTRSSQDIWGSSRPWSSGLRDMDKEGYAYEGPKWANSPWYHKPWGETSRGNPWLTNEETQDLFNTYMLSELSASYNQRLSPTDEGGWSRERVIEELNAQGVDPVGKLNGIVTVDDGTGYINSVLIDSENYGAKEFSGSKFRSIFNLRSLGTLVIWTSRYDVQKS